MSYRHHRVVFLHDSIVSIQKVVDLLLDRVGRDTEHHRKGQDAEPEDYVAAYLMRKPHLHTRTHTHARTHTHSLTHSHTHTHSHSHKKLS